MPSCSHDADPAALFRLLSFYLLTVQIGWPLLPRKSQRSVETQACPTSCKPVAVCGVCLADLWSASAALLLWEAWDVLALLLFHSTRGFSSSSGLAGSSPSRKENPVIAQFLETHVRDSFLHPPVGQCLPWA